MPIVKPALTKESTRLLFTASNLYAMETIADRLRALRAHFGVSQSQIGVWAGGLSKSAVSQWERGLSTPERDALNALRKSRDVNQDWVMNGDGEMFIAKITQPNPPANVATLTPPPDPLTAELLALVQRMDRTGLARLVGVASQLVEQYPRANANHAR
jgi:transcriptional regulator with XRE-family HTH domain